MLLVTYLNICASIGIALGSTTPQLILAAKTPGQSKQNVHLAIEKYSDISDLYTSYRIKL
jgi:hypothetical protein